MHVSCTLCGASYCCFMHSVHAQAAANAMLNQYQIQGTLTCLIRSAAGVLESMRAQRLLCLAARKLQQSAAHKLQQLK